MGLTKAGKAKKGQRTWHGQKAIQFQRKPIVPVTPNFGASQAHQATSKWLQNEEEGLAFIDEEQIEEGQGLTNSPTQVRTIRK